MSSNLSPFSNRNVIQGALSLEPEQATRDSIPSSNSTIIVGFMADLLTVWNLDQHTTTAVVVFAVYFPHLSFNGWHTLSS